MTSTTTEHVDLNVYFDEREDAFRVTAYPVVKGSTDTSRSLYSLTIPAALQEQCRMEFDEDDWVDEGSAPTWLDDLIQQHLSA